MSIHFLICTVRLSVKVFKENILLTAKQTTQA